MLSHAPFAFKEVLKNVAMSIGPIRSRRLQGHRTSTSADPSQLYRYAFVLPDFVLKHIGPATGKDVLEIGPGDHLATGLTFLALGAKSYTALDRFPGGYASPNACAWYEMVEANFSKQFSIPFPAGLERFPNDSRVTILRTSIEQLHGTGQFDIVCSFAVGEHVSDVGVFAAANRQLLKPSGHALHYVDFSGHAWDKDATDPLMFRRIPEFLWTAMGSNRGYPNRVSFEQFNRILTDAGLKVRLASKNHFPNIPTVQNAVYVLSV